ncbi:MAG: hypothetical protein VKQ33_05200 [Candidatus Sericytochromatia bacterium]|nr:hypothetical protein [Candidatus Sericytochromatia bacterium]
MSDPRTPLSRRLLALLCGATASAAPLAGCISPVLPPGTGARPGLALNQHSARGASAITLLGPSVGPAEQLTPAGRELTLVASVGQATSIPLRLSVEPGQAGAAFRLSQLAAAERLEMPYSDRFRSPTAAPATSPGRRLLATPARSLGSTEAFWINTGSSSSADDRQRTCALKRISANALLYVDLEAKEIPDAQLDRLLDEWEQRIYPRLTAVFGREARPGIDGEERIFLVLSPAVDNWGKEKGLMGYFWSRDLIPGGGGNSNQKEVLFMTDQLFDRPELTSFGTLAHEFQHLLNFSRKSARLGYRLSEDTWLDEGLSMYAMEVAGYGLPAGDYHIAKDLRVFQESPEDFSLTDWSGNPNGFAYGQSYLFVRYLVDRYGPGVIAEILDSNKAGVACIADLLKPRGTTFAEHFRAWAIANLVSDAPLAQGTPYTYQGLPLRGTFRSASGQEDIELRGFQTRPGEGADVTLRLRPWSTAYLTYASQTPLPWRLRLGVDTAERLLGATIVP